MAQAPAQVVAPPLAPVPTLEQNKNYIKFYNDATKDKFQGAYGPVMAIFNSPGDGSTPASIRELVSNDPTNSSMGYLALVIPPNQPNTLGKIYGLHTVSKYVTRLGQPATPWDNTLFASIGDVVGNQILATVHFPADAFARQGGGAFYNMPTQQLLDATFGANPNQESVGPYANAGPGTELVGSRNVVGVPHRYMRHFLPGPLTPRQAWEMVAHDVIANGDHYWALPFHQCPLFQ
jgi:hypothetical protein